MEEARTSYLENLGYSYKRLEDEGLISPVVKIDIQYKKPTTYSDIIDIEVELKEVSLATVKFSYSMTCQGVIVCTAESEHCFIDKNGRSISLKRTNPKVYDFFVSCVKKRCKCSKKTTKRQHNF